MIVNLFFDVLFIFLIVVSAADSDSIWPSSQEGLFPDIEFSSNGGALALNEPALPFSPTTLPSDESKSLFDNPEDNNLFLSGNFDLVSDDSFRLADCSSSVLSPVIGKSRVRRLDGGSAGCQNRDSTLPSGSGSSFDDLPAFETLLSTLERAYGSDAAQEELKHNSICSLVTANKLPWGVCSSGDPLHVEAAIRHTPDPSLGVAILFHLYYCSLSPGGLAICPPGRKFYCCENFDEGLLGVNYAEYCALLSALQGAGPQQ